MNSWIDVLTPTPGTATVAASSDVVIAQAQKAIGVLAVAWVVETVAAIHDEMAVAHTPPLNSVATDFCTGAAERQAFESCFLIVLSAMAHDVAAVELAIPDEAVHQVRLRVRQGTPLGVILRTVRATHARAQDAIFAVLQDTCAPQTLGDDIRTVGGDLFAYVDVIVAELIRHFEDERSLWHGRLPALRQRMVATIIAGDDAPDDAENILGLRLNHHHLVAVCREGPGGYAPDRDVVKSATAERIARSVGAATSLTLEVNDLTVIIWSFSTPPTADALNHIDDADLPSWATLGVGTIAPKAAGLRESYRSAIEADAVARLQSTSVRQVWWSDSVRLQALLIGDPDRARTYTRRVLGALAADGPKTADLRETLRQFLLAGRSRQAAATALHLAPTTVAYRVRSAEALLGRPTSQSNLEIQVALELAHTFSTCAE